MSTAARTAGFIISSCLLLITGCASGASAGLDQAELSAGSLPKDTAIHVHLFSADQADLGSPEHVDTAKAMVKSASHLVATDIVHTLRDAGFTKVTLDETEGGAAPGCLNLTGKFTVIDPGSQDLRIWIGFGAGESRVCVEGTLTDAEGQTLGSFSDCESGIGWGGNGPQIDSEARTIGEKIGHFVSGIAK